MRTVNCEQGTPEWLAARTGRITASRMNDVLAKIGKGEAATRRNYKAEIVVERLTGQPTPEGYVSREMQWGRDNEQFARAAYELRKGVMIDEVGFVIHPTMDFAGASPDGIIDGRKGIEIKCPNTATHLQYILDGVAPVEYRPQMTLNMICAEVTEWDFVSFDPRVPEHLQLFVVPFRVDFEAARKMEKEIELFNAEVDAIVEKLSAVVV